MKKNTLLVVLASPILFPILFVTLCMSPLPSARAEEPRPFGLLGGLSFPRALFAKAEYNFAESWGVDYQTSLSIYWSIQQLDGIYYFKRSEWSPYVTLGLQNWNFYGFSGSTNYDGILFGSGNQAATVTVSLGLIFVAPTGFAMDFNLAADEFINSPLNLQYHVVPEGNFSVGYFF